MTVIRLVTKDQELIIAEKPLLASGDVNSVVLHVDFDSAWDRYIARTAVFYTSKDSTVYEKLLTNGECVIPDEVLTSTGTLFVGVRGVPIDGTAQKTSALVKYKIVEGAKPGTYTIHVTPDLYQQYIEAIKGQFDPVTTQMRSDFDDQMESWGADVEALKSRIMDIGNYTGDGESSRTHTFNFPVRFLVILPDEESKMQDCKLIAIRGMSKAHIFGATNSDDDVVATLQWEENTVRVHAIESGDVGTDAAAMNKSGQKYWYAAFV